ncbi:MAG TPA: carboxypeptidase regulatory-like domain-containing protein [Chthonomonadaceae bacterium]|nr:carboxypeptidase regulatory-like domain-containing protein [Chthonomonadaceae bacterium]
MLPKGFQNKIGRVGAWILAVLGLLGLMAASTGCGGGGGGGGGGGATTTVTGTVLQVDTASAPAHVATVTIGGQTVQTNKDGTFKVAGVPITATTAVVSDTADNLGTRTLAIQLANAPANDLGNIYLSAQGYTATVTGRVVTMVSGQTQPVGGAVVTISGSSATTATNGTFTLSNMPVGLGTIAGEIIGQVTASGFLTKTITSDQLPIPLTAGTNNIGDLLIAQPSGSTPPPPYTITGTVTVSGKPASGVPVSISLNNNNLGSTTTDSNGAYFFWVVPGKYTITASPSGVTPKSEQVTLQEADVPITAPTLSF